MRSKTGVLAITRASCSLLHGNQTSLLMMSTCQGPSPTLRTGNELGLLLMKSPRSSSPANLCLYSVIFTTSCRILPSGNDLQHPEGQIRAETTSRHPYQSEEARWADVPYRTRPPADRNAVLGPPRRQELDQGCLKQRRARSPISEWSSEYRDFFSVDRPRPPCVANKSPHLMRRLADLCRSIA